MHFTYLIAHSCGIVAQNCIGSPLLLPKSVLGEYEHMQPLWCCNSENGHDRRPKLPSIIAILVIGGVSCSRYEEIVLETELLELNTFVPRINTAGAL